MLLSSMKCLQSLWMIVSCTMNLVVVILADENDSTPTCLWKTEWIMNVLVRRAIMCQGSKEVKTTDEFLSYDSFTFVLETVIISWTDSDDAGVVPYE